MCALACAALPSPASADGLLIFGTIRAGGADNAFEKIVDLATGQERTITIEGPSSSQRGFDGQLWSFVNGTVTAIDLPSEVADETAEMWAGQTAWRIVGTPGEVQRQISLPQASPMTLKFDPRTRRVSSVVIDEDYGPTTISFGDWRRVGSYVYPFRQDQVGPSGGQSSAVAQSVRWVGSIDPGMVSRPPDMHLAHLAAPVVTVPFHSPTAGDAHIQLTARVNATAAQFIFDTGAANIVTIDAAKRLGISASGGINIGGVGEATESGGFGLVDRIAIGGAALDRQSFMIIPSPFGAPSPSDPAGLLGYEFLANFVTTIDYRAGTMSFRRNLPPHPPGVRLPFTTDGHDIVVVADIDGKPALFRLDTGDGGTVTVFPNYAASMGLDPQNGTVKRSAGGAGGDVLVHSGTIGSFSLAGVRFPNLPADFSRNRQGAFASRHLAGNLGARVLRCFRITFDYPHHQLWLEPQFDTPLCPK